MPDIDEAEHGGGILKRRSNGEPALGIEIDLAPGSSSSSTPRNGVRSSRDETRRSERPTGFTPGSMIVARSPEAAVSSRKRSVSSDSGAEGRAVPEMLRVHAHPHPSRSASHPAYAPTGTEGRCVSGRAPHEWAAGVMGRHPLEPRAVGWCCSALAPHRQADCSTLDILLCLRIIWAHLVVSPVSFLFVY